ncbi:leukocyte-associated immunoglobulin-like receptor 1 isoform X2 [Phyllostomus hastatus]|uniref:leukocyte-associated immunoglobulin-like receptor 1 isoform X2 n=1 Tax=Phyllostomus hastatus TaxID=9423 RepID=UPI001E683ACF|nr:leukocyte-associated immunoglobulin-like receptor 1 isoform X2 [Phyllostomus hastatus]
MGPHPTSLLVLVLCLGQTIHMENRPPILEMGTGCKEGRECSGNTGVLPKPFIRAEPGPVIIWGQPVTIVCRGPAWADTFRLEEQNGRSVYKDQTTMSQRGSHWTEATFHIDMGNEFTAGRYFCHYLKGSKWSEHSEILELKVTGAPRVISSTPTTLTKPPSTAESFTSRATLERTGHMQTNSLDTKTSILSPEHLYILVGICVASLLCLLLLALLLVHHHRQKKRGLPSSKDEEPRPQERLSPTDDLKESSADVATIVDALPEENGDMHSPSPAAGDPEEVTYAQLDQQALTWRAARTESPQPMEPTAESSMYAAFPRH